MHTNVLRVSWQNRPLDLNSPAFANACKKDAESEYSKLWIYISLLIFEEHRPFRHTRCHLLVKKESIHRTIQDGAPRLENLSRICERGMELKALLKYTKTAFCTFEPLPSDFAMVCARELLHPRCFWTFCMQIVFGNWISPKKVGSDLGRIARIF